MTELLESVAEVIDGLKPAFDDPRVSWHDGYAVVYDRGRHIVRPTTDRPPLPSWENAPNYVEPHPEDIEARCSDTGWTVPSCVVNWGCQLKEHKHELAEQRRAWRRGKET